MLTAVSYATYKAFAKKYKIPLSVVVNGKRKLKSIPILKLEIKNYEKLHKVKSGLYV